VRIYDLDEDETAFYNSFPDRDTAALYKQFAIGLSIVDPECRTHVGEWGLGKRLMIARGHALGLE